jgi:PLP dependent protein
VADQPPPTIDSRAVAENIAAVLARIRVHAGDRPVQLIAVTKGFGADAISAAVAGGCTAIGENYAQELNRKYAEHRASRPDLPPPEIHFIGHLQRNKVRSLASVVDVWQTVDRPSLVDEVARRAPGARVFVQVNTTAESAKGGCAPDDTATVVDAARQAGLNVEGLMTIGPTSTDPVGTGAAFALLRGLADREGLIGCSMGMSADLEIALDHGATHVRIGSALFGERPHRDAPIG